MLKSLIKKATLPIWLAGFVLFGPCHPATQGADGKTDKSVKAADLLNSVAVIGVLGEPLGTVVEVHGTWRKADPTKSKHHDRYFQIMSINGKAVSTRLELPWSDMRQLQGKEIPRQKRDDELGIQSGKMWHLWAYESGVIRGHPAAFWKASGVNRAAFQSRYFFEEFRPELCYLHTDSTLKPNSAVVPAVAVPHSVQGRDLLQNIAVIGRLGAPLGTIVEIDGAWSAVGKDATKLQFRVNSVNGRKIDPSVEFAASMVSLGNPKIKKRVPSAGERWEMRGYESGRILGLPDGLQRLLGINEKPPSKEMRDLVFEFAPEFCYASVKVVKTDGK